MNIFEKILYLAWSLLFCVRYLPFSQSLKIPIRLYKGIKVVKMYRGGIVLKGNVRFSMLVLGTGGSVGCQQFSGALFIERGGKMEINGKAIFAEGSSIRIDNNGKMNIGNNFYCNKNCFFYCSETITFGNDCLCGWNVVLNTTDGHSVSINGESNKKSGDIVIGKHVWIASYVNIAKGITIADGSVVAQNSLVKKSFIESNLLIGGVPAKILRCNVDWKL